MRTDQLPGRYTVFLLCFLCLGVLSGQGRSTHPKQPGKELGPALPQSSVQPESTLLGEDPAPPNTANADTLFRVEASDGTVEDGVWVSWDSVEGAASYDLYRSVVSVQDVAEKIAGKLPEPGFLDTETWPGLGFFYWAVARFADGSHLVSTPDRGYAPSPTTRPVAWGLNSFGQASVPPNLRGIGRIAAGPNHSLAINLDGRLFAWGRNDDGETRVPPLPLRVVSADAGDGFSAAVLENGELALWGKDPGIDLSLVEPHVLVQVAAGKNHIVVLTALGEVRALGSNSHAQLEVPPGLAEVMTVAAGDHHSLALLWDGTVVAWGANGAGQADVPDQLFNVAKVSAGSAHSLALLWDGSVVAWGSNQFGQLEIPELPLPALDIAAGLHENLVTLGDGSILNWGQSPPDAMAGSEATQQPVQYLIPPESLPIAWNISASRHALALVTELPAPAAPTNLSASDGLLQEAIQLQWSPADRAEFYLVFRAQSGSVADADLVSGSVFDLEFMDHLADPEIVYTYWVIAGNDAGFSPLSVPDQGFRVDPFSNPPAAPVGFRVSAGTSAEAVLMSWQPVPGALVYDIYRWPANDPEAPAERVAADLSLNRFTDTSALPGVEYAYSVVARNEVGEGPPSAFKRGYVGLQPPPQDGWRYSRADKPGSLSSQDRSFLPSSPQLIPRFSHPSFRSAQRVLTGDVDGDGMLEIVGMDNQEIVVFDHNGNPQAVFPTKGRHLSVLEDIDNDGVLEIGIGDTASSPPLSQDGRERPAVTGIGNQITCYFYDHNGTRLKEFSYPLNAALDPAGREDAINSVTMTPLLATGNGRLIVRLDAQNLFFPRGLAAFDLSTGELLWHFDVGPRVLDTFSATDVDGDGQMEILLSLLASADGKSSQQSRTHDSSLYLIILDENGQVQLNHQPEGLGQGSLRNHFLDFNNDGIPEIVSIHDARNVANDALLAPERTGFWALRVFTLDGDLLGDFSSPDDAEISYAFGDINADGFKDLILAPLVESPVFWVSGRFDLVRNGQIAGRLEAMADLVGNGILEIVLFAADNLIVILNEHLEVVEYLPVPGTGPVTVGDVDGNGRMELIASTPKGLFCFEVGDRPAIEVADTISDVRATDGWFTRFVRISWTGEPGATYAIWRGINDNPFESELIGLVDNDQFRFFDFTAQSGRTYTYWVSYLDGYGYGSGDTGYRSARSQNAYAWGGNDGEQSDIPADLAEAVAVAAGKHHSLALLADGSVVAWGRNDNGQVNVPEGLDQVVAIAVGFNHSLALRADGSLVAWGDNAYGQSTVPEWLTGVVAIDAGARHSLALLADGRVVSWGDSQFGQTYTPVGLEGVTAIAAGAFHNLALRKDGTVVTWGGINPAELFVPLGLDQVLQVDAGWSHSIALRQNGQVVVWGNNEYGQSSIPPALNFASPASPPSEARQSRRKYGASDLSSGTASSIVAGAFHNLADVDGQGLIAWGNDESGQATVPPELNNPELVAAGVDHNVVISAAAETVPFTDWATYFELDADDPELAVQDADNDGAVELREYAFGTNPRIPETALFSSNYDDLWMMMSLHPDGSGTVRVRQPNYVESIQYTLESSASGGLWNIVPGLFSIVGEEPERELQILEQAVPASPDQNFFRVKATHQ